LLHRTTEGLRKAKPYHLFEQLIANILVLLISFIVVVVQWMNGNSGSVSPADGKNQYTVWTVDGSTKTVKAELVNDTGTTDYTQILEY